MDERAHRSRKLRHPIASEWMPASDRGVPYSSTPRSSLIEASRNAPVELVGDTPSKKAGAPLLGCDGGAVRYENYADGSCEKAPDYSLYLQLLREWRKFAGSFAELPNAARFICVFEMYF